MTSNPNFVSNEQDEKCMMKNQMNTKRGLTGTKTNALKAILVLVAHLEWSIAKKI